MDLAARIENDFTYHAPSEDDVWKFLTIRNHAKVLALLIDSLVPDGREKSSALTKLEEAVFWSNAGIARST